MRNTFSHHQTTELEVIQPTEHCIQMLIYIDILSSRVPSSPGTQYPPTLRQVNTIDQFQAGLGSITLPVLSQIPFFNCIYDLLLTVQKGHARRVNAQYRVFS
jgi:hypothetical protein